MTITTTSTSNVREALQRRLHQELNPGEAVLWTGQPQARRSSAREIPATLFFLAWGAFGPLWFSFNGPALSTHWWITRVVGLVWCTIGLAGVLSPLWAWRRAQRTLYALTNERALVFRLAGTDVECTSLSLQRLQALRCVERWGGIGDVVLLRESWGNSDDVTLRGFLGVADARRVYQRLQRQVRACDAARP